MRLLTLTSEVEDLKITDAGWQDFGNYVGREIEDGLSSRYRQEQSWIEAFRRYEAVPHHEVVNVPIENAPNHVVPLGAIAVDAIYATAIDQVFTVSPVLTARDVKGDKTASVKAMQKFVNWGAANEWDLRMAAEESFLDNVKIGTGVYYVPFTEDKRKTRIGSVKSRGPRVLSIPPEDALAPPGSYDDPQKWRWLGLRTWYTRGELEAEAERSEWDIEHVAPAGKVGWVRTNRELLGKSLTSNSDAEHSQLFEIWRVFAYYDIDGDEVDEDLVAVWDRTSRTLLKVEYNGYDRRPVEWMVYQRRGHLAYGLGVMDMTADMQDEVTDVHNYALLNSLLANARLYMGREGVVSETDKIWPSKIITTSGDPKSDLVSIQMADIYPSMGAFQAFPIGMAERRVGINDLSTPRPSAVLGSRTPGITALSLLQQSNRRFTPAFDAMRFATAGAARQCLYRYQERLLAGDVEVHDHIIKVMGDDEGALVVALLKDRAFDESVEVELTASSATLNRDVERQNALLLVQILSTYYQKALELVAIASNPQTPEPVRDVAKKIAVAATEIIERTIRTFDQIRDPVDFLIRFDEEIDKAAEPAQQGLGALMQLLTGGQGTGGQNGAPAAPPATVG